MNINCLLCGVGGQGTVLASKLIANAAINKGFFARTAETIGMAQRGGCVVSHVRIGETVHSPLIPRKQADLLMGFEPGEAVRCLPYLKQDGIAIVNTKPLKPVTASLGAAPYDAAQMIEYLKQNTAELIFIDGEAVCRECGSSKVLNTALLGAATGCGVLGITLKEMEQALCALLPEKFHPLNLKALRAGAAFAK